MKYTRARVELSKEEAAITRMIAARAARGETIQRIAITSRVGPTNWTTYRLLLRLARLSGLRYPNRRPSRDQINAAVRAVRDRGLTFRKAALEFNMSRTAVHRYVQQRRQKSIDQAGELKLVDGERPFSRHKRSWLCPEHGRVNVWPCVACAALAARAARD